MANALNYAIVIVSQCNDNYRMQVILPRNNGSTGMRVAIMKLGEHYDGVAKVNYITCQDSDEPRYDQHADKPSYDQSKHRSKFVNGDQADASVGNSDEIKPHSKPLRILAWNINGLTDHKLTDDILGSLFKSHDIILLSETWTGANDEYILDGFEFMNFRPLMESRCEFGDDQRVSFHRIQIRLIAI